MTKEKMTLDEKLHARKLHRPNPAVYGVLTLISRFLYFKKYNAHVTYRIDPKEIKGQHILISNHASRYDYAFVAIPFLPHRYNIIAGYNEFFRAHLKGVFGLGQVIPKKNFTADVYTIRETSRILKKGGNVILFPEGMNSISGENQPVALGTGKFVKHYGLPVYYTLIKGGHLTCPKYTTDDRPGRIDVEVGQAFTAEEIASMTAEEIEERINKLLTHDDYAWNREMRYKYQTNGRAAENLHDLLYWCPRCKREFTMEGKGDTIRCRECGNGATLDESYVMTPFDETCVIPKTQTAWYRMERKRIREMVQDEAFSLSEEVDLGTLLPYEYLTDYKTSEIVGSGTLTLDRSGLTYEGTRNGENFTFHLTPSEVPTYGMCTDTSRFYTFYRGEFMEFYPKSPSVIKWLQATEEIHRITGGKWKDFVREEEA